MDVFDKKEDCSGCTACRQICPTGCISMVADEKGFIYPQIDTKNCTNCGLCRTICPFTGKGKIAVQSLPEPAIYAVKHRDSMVLRASSSGGAFTAISDYILTKGGIVYGAAFDKHLIVRHVRCDTAVERDRLRGSKYVQSDLGDVFLSVKADLDSKRDVLFSGTPCQTAGLYAYLGKAYCNLLCCDLVCHGVPSPRIFKDYVNTLDGGIKNNISQINFRDKISGWSNFSFSLVIAGKKKSVRFGKDPYCSLFSDHLILRPACHNCKFTSYIRPSDITLADFWGIYSSRPGFADENGVSLVLINTEKGQALFEAIKSKICYERSNKTECSQPNLVRPTFKPANLDCFWRDYSRKGFDYVVYKYTLKNPINRARRIFYLILSRTRILSFLKAMKSLLLNRSTPN